MKPLMTVFGLLLAGATLRAQDVDGLVKQLSADDVDQRRQAARLLGEAGEAAKPAVPALVTALKDQDTFVRRFAAQSLGTLGPVAGESVPALKSAMSDNRREVAEAAARSLGKVGGVQPLLDTLQDKNAAAGKRLLAMNVLGGMGDAAKPAVPVLADLVKNRDKDLRVDAVVALGNLGPTARDAVPVLREAMDKDNKDRTMREAARAALMRITGRGKPK